MIMIFALIGIALLLGVCLFVFGTGQNRNWERENQEQAAALKEDKK